jgi:hypothetical protein
MPPKQQPAKTDMAKKQKVVEDKTFGLKNKNKSKNVQKYVQTLKQSVQPKADPKLAAKVRGSFTSRCSIGCCLFIEDWICSFDLMKLGKKKLCKLGFNWVPVCLARKCGHFLEEMSILTFNSSHTTEICSVYEKINVS